jgi:hypothetical protein
MMSKSGDKSNGDRKIEIRVADNAKHGVRGVTPA